MHLKNLKIGHNYKLILLGAVVLYVIYFAFVVVGWDALFNPQAKAQSNENTATQAPLVASPANVASSLLLSMGVSSPDVELDFADILSNSEAGQNLYSVVFNKINVQPEKKAFKDTAQGFGLTLAEAEAVKGGSPTPFTNIIKSSSPALTQQQAVNRVSAFQERYQERKEFYEFQTEMITQYAPTEIFYNGDLADSGFDLVYDLHIIEQILFQKTEDLVVGGKFNNGVALGAQGGIGAGTGAGFGSSTGAGFGAGTGAGFGSSVGLGAGATQTVQNAQTANGSESSNGTQSVYVPKESLQNISDYAKTKALPTSAQGDLLDPTFCANDYSLGLSLINAPTSLGAEELQTVSEALVADANASNNLNGSDNIDSGDSNSGDTTVGNATAESYPDLAKTTQQLQEEATSLTDYFEKVPVSNSPFKLKDLQQCYEEDADGKGSGASASICFEVNFKYKTASAYAPGETCIACEIAQINDDLWNTLKNNLSPNKAPGNIFESAKCKKGLVSNPNINVVLMFNPVATPNNSDLIGSKDIVDRWNEFTKTFKPGLFTDQYNKRESSPVSAEEQKKLEDEVYQKSLYDDASEYAVSNSQNLISQQQLQNEINQIVNASVAQTQRQIREFEAGSSGAEFGEFYQLLSYEMDKMQTFLSIYQNTFAEISSEICPNIKSKPDAS